MTRAESEWSYPDSTRSISHVAGEDAPVLSLGDGVEEVDDGVAHDGRTSGTARALCGRERVAVEVDR